MFETFAEQAYTQMKETIFQDTYSQVTQAQPNINTTLASTFILTDGHALRNRDGDTLLSNYTLTYMRG
jgi:hypothetical protein